MATPFAAQCGVSIANDYGTLGTFTKSSLSTPTPEEWKASFTDGTYWNEMTPYLKSQFQMAACGLQRNTFYDWLMSSNKQGMGALITTHKMDRGASIIQPFIMGKQMTPVNNENWVITAGWAVASYTAGSTGPLTAAQLITTPATSSFRPYRVIRVIPGYGTSYSLPMDARYFTFGHNLYILSVAATVSLQGQWQIKAAAMDSGATYIDVVIQDQMDNSDDTGYTAESTPTSGLVVVGINNVNDYETYCHNRLAVNPIKHVPFWYQTYRNCRRVSSAYMEMFGRLMADNAYYEAFVGLPLAEYNRQDEAMAQREFCTSFLFQEKISGAQRLSGDPNWGDLENITSVTGTLVDPGTGGQLQAKRANMIGVLPQLKACGTQQYVDHQTQTIDIKNWLETEIFNLHRNRQQNNVKSANQIDIRVNSTLADQFATAFIKYSNWKLNDSVRIIIEQGDTIGVPWSRFKLYKPQGVWLNVIAERFLDDLSNSMDQLAVGTRQTTVTAAHATARGNMCLTLDLGKGGTVYPAVLDSNRTEVTTGELANLAKIDATFACVMKNPTIKTSCTSKTVTAIVECPLLSQWDENFSTFSFTAP